MIARAHLAKLVHQLKTVQIIPSIRFSTEFPQWTSTTTTAAEASKTQSKTDDFLKYGLYQLLNVFHGKTSLKFHTHFSAL